MTQYGLVALEHSIEVTPAVFEGWPVAPGGVRWSVDETALLDLWYRLREGWLDLPKGRQRQRSAHTRAAYAKASLRWFEWLAGIGIRPWQATSTHVRGWMEWLEASGLGPASVAQQVAACSSFYSFVIREKHLVNGLERSAFEDAVARTRENPFKVGNSPRPKVDPYHKASPLAPGDLVALLGFLEGRRGTLTGSRNYALILTHLLTGARSSEICRLRVRDVRANQAQPGGFVYDWRGKGGKEARKSFPARAYHAIVAYLKLAGRWLPGVEDGGMAPDEPIFPALFVHSVRNLPGGEGRGDDGETLGAMSSRNVQRIFQTALRGAGVANAERYRVHDLRHTLAIQHYRQFKDVKAVQVLLNHESLATTMIYLDHLEEPVDAYSEAIYQQVRMGI